MSKLISILSVILVTLTANAITVLWDPNTETIDQFLARTGAKPSTESVMEQQVSNQQPKTDVQKAAEAGYNDLKGDRKPLKVPLEKMPIAALVELAEDREIDLKGETAHAKILAILKAAIKD